jgi:hypothetical protein
MPHSDDKDFKYDARRTGVLVERLQVVRVRGNMGSLEEPNRHSVTSAVHDFRRNQH